MKSAGIKWSYVDDVLIAVADEGQVVDAEWEAFLRDMKQKPFAKFLTAVTGALEVGSAQRKRINEIVKRGHIPVTLITDQKIVRGMATAASWVGIDVKAFSWADARAATKHVEPKDSMLADRIYDELVRLKASLGR